MGARYNIAPTSTVPVIAQRRDELDQTRRWLRGMRWGLVPSWAKDVSVGNRMFNARAESLQEKSAFRAPFQKRRCLLPASGYFEWRARGAGPKPARQPYYITPADGSVLAFAGVWEFWRSESGDPVLSTTIITTAAVGAVTEIHDRMPLILPAADWDAWLSLELTGADVAPLLAPPAADLVAALELRPVSSRVGNVRFDDPGLLDRVVIQDSQLTLS